MNIGFGGTTVKILLKFTIVEGMELDFERSGIVIFFTEAGDFLVLEGIYGYEERSYEVEESD